MSTQLPLVVYVQEYKPKSQRRRIRDLPTEERPLYRLRRHGSSVLSTAELLALLSGTADAPGLSQE